MISNSDDENLMQVKHSTPSKVRFADEAGPSTAPAVTATPSTPNTDTSTVTSPSTDDLYTDGFNFALSKIFSSTLMASLTSKDAILKKIRDCVLTENEERCKQISPYIHSFWRTYTLRMDVYASTTELQYRIRSRMLTRRQFPQHTQEAGEWQIWRHMHGDIETKTAKCNPCVKIGKNLKSIIPSSKWASLKLCKVPNEEIPTDFGGPIYNGKN